MAQRLNADFCLFGIFDGHGGDEVSRVLPEMVGKEFKKRFLIATKIDKDKIGQILGATFMEVDKQLRASDKNYEAKGSTGAVVVVHREFIVAAHCGDTRIQIFGNESSISNPSLKTRPKTKLIYNSTDHKPNHPIENTRITRAGGEVFMNRISTKQCPIGISVARSFGDFRFKSNIESVDRDRLEKMDNLMIVNPEIAVIDLEGSEKPKSETNTKTKIKSILIACDGVTDVLSNNDIKIIHDTSDFKDLSSNLVMEAYREGSLDNISACCVEILC